MIYYKYSQAFLSCLGVVGQKGSAGLCRSTIQNISKKPPYWGQVGLPGGGLPGVGGVIRGPKGEPGSY